MRLTRSAISLLALIVLFTQMWHEFSAQDRYAPSIAVFSGVGGFRHWLKLSIDFQIPHSSRIVARIDPWMQHGQSFIKTHNTLDIESF